jgi:adenosylhomocysteine nucleosidase
MARCIELPRGFEQRVMPEIAIIAALEREIGPLLKSWRNIEQEHSGKHLGFYEGENCVAVCGGIGPVAARRAAEAAVALYRPNLLVSVGFGGALESNLRVGEVLEFRRVIDASDGSRSDTGYGDGTLVSFSSVAGKEQKQKLANSYGARVVDMEAAAVAKSAQAHGLEFRAIKVVSDEIGFPMPPMEKFITNDGQFRSARFAAHVAIRPWKWANSTQLRRNSRKAADALSEYLRRNLQGLRMSSHALPATATRRDGL